MSYQLDDLTTLQTLLRVDLTTRLERALEKGQVDASMTCPSCHAELCSTEHPRHLKRNVTWTNPCECGHQTAEYGLHDDVRGGNWFAWRAWDSGRLMFTKDKGVVQAIWQHVMSQSGERIFALTKPLIMRRPMIQQLQDNGYNLTFREPRNYEAPPSMETRYELSSLWEFSFPDRAKVWDLFDYQQHVELQELVTKLIDEEQSLSDGAANASLGSLEDDYLKRLKTKCFEIKLANKQEGEGAFKLLTQVRNLRAQEAQAS